MDQRTADENPPAAPGILPAGIVNGDSNSPSTSYDRKRKLGEFTITAYTAGYESTQKKKGQKGYGITATGTKVTEGRTIAADWGVLPPGTVVQIDGLPGTYTVEDKGGAVDGKHIDLFVQDLGRARKWGRQKREVTVIEWGKGKP